MMRTYPGAPQVPRVVCPDARAGGGDKVRAPVAAARAQAGVHGLRRVALAAALVGRIVQAGLGPRGVAREVVGERRRDG